MKTALRTIAVIVISVGLLVTAIACKKSVPTLPYELNPETTIPDHFVTHISDNLFSISYPPNWEVDTSLIEQAKTFAEQWTGTNNMDIPVEHVNILLIAGKPFSQGYHPNVTIVSEPLAEDIETIEDLAKAEAQSIEAVCDDYEELSRVKTTINGKESTIIEYEGDLPGIGSIHNLSMFTIDDDTIWGINCTLSTSVADFSDHKDDFYSIIRSFRIME